MLPEYPSAVENLLVIKIGKFLGLSIVGGTIAPTPSTMDNS